MELKEAPVTDHQYFGNVCSGFGGSLECKYLNIDTGRPCGRPPYAHQLPQHRADVETVESQEAGYIPKHLGAW